MEKQNIPLLIFMLCIATIIYLFVSDNTKMREFYIDEDDDAPEDLRSWVLSMSESEEPEYGISC